MHWTYCAKCGEYRVVCCDSGFRYDPVSRQTVHDTPLCLSCCPGREHKVIWEGKTVAGGVYERGA